MGQFGFGQSVRRVEDYRLITGHGRYTDDITLGRQAHAVVVRSPYAHARIASIDTTEAAAAPGVLGVFTGADVAADGLGTVPCLVPLKNKDGSRMYAPPRPLLTQDVVRHVGDGVALVVAETLAAAEEAAELVAVDYEMLPSITSTSGALSPDAPQVWPEANGNLCFDWEAGDRKAVDAAFEKAHHVTRVDLVNNRVVVNSMEPRVAIGDYDDSDGKYTLYTSSQGVHNLQRQLAQAILKVPTQRVRVVTRDVGGGFGMKIFMYPEYALVVWAAKKVGRPVKWTEGRSEAFTTDTQGRDHVTTAELALDQNGKFLALRVQTTANLGAYLSNFGPYIPTMAGSKLYAAVYTFPAVLYAVKGVFTNTVPVDAYRGAGRPEAAYCVERLVDAAARDLGLPPDEIRRRNFIPPEAMPFKTVLGSEYDSGEFARNMEDAMKAADWAGFEQRKQESLRRGKLRGRGMSYYIEACGGGQDESATITFDETGNITVHVGNQSNGQGHETAYAQLTAETLGVPIESVKVFQGDSDRYGFGRGTGGSRALPVGGSAVLRACEKVIEVGKKIASRQMEAAEADIEFEDGTFRVAGTDKVLSIVDVAKSSYMPNRVDIGEVDPGIDETARFMPGEATYPNGCHICELEVDPDTGTVHIDRYTVVDDFGRVMNPLLLEGQVHGGIAQGIGQALLEHTVYDEESGQLVTGSFMDYCMPRADDVPRIDFSYNEIPCSRNPLGVKGAGEAGAIGAPPAVINAVVDALSERGVRHVDMPATPERLWRAANEPQKAA